MSKFNRNYILGIISFCLLLGSEAKGRYNPVYIVDYMLTVAKGKNLIEAKKIAIRQAKRKAFEHLFKRLVMEGEIEKELSISDIDNMIISFSVLNEQMAKNVYRANMRFIFNKQRVYDFFKRNNMVFVRGVAAPILIIPVLQMNDRIFLWEIKNYWLHYLLQRQDRLTKGFVPIMIPTGDIRDIGLIKVEDLIIADDNYYGNLKLMMQRYRAKGLLVIHAKIGKNYSFKMLYFDGNSTQVLPNMLDEKIKSYYKNFSNRKHFFSYLISSMVHSLELHVKKYYEIKEFDDGTQLDLILRSKDLGEILRIEKMIKKASGIESYQIVAISQGEMVYKVSLIDLNEFRRYLVNSNLKIVKDEDGVIIING